MTSSRPEHATLARPPRARRRCPTPSSRSLDTSLRTGCHDGRTVGQQAAVAPSTSAARRGSDETRLRSPWDERTGGIRPTHISTTTTWHVLGRLVCTSGARLGGMAQRAPGKAGARNPESSTNKDPWISLRFASFRAHWQYSQSFDSSQGQPRFRECTSSFGRLMSCSTEGVGAGLRDSYINARP